MVAHPHELACVHTEEDDSDFDGSAMEEDDEDESLSGSGGDSSSEEDEEDDDESAAGGGGKGAGLRVGSDYDSGTCCDDCDDGPRQEDPVSSLLSGPTAPILYNHHLQRRTRTLTAARRTRATRSTAISFDGRRQQSLGGGLVVAFGLLGIV